VVEYSEAFRNRMVQKMSGPRARSARSLAAEVGVRQPTLSRWLREASIVEDVAKVAKTKASPAAPRRPADWSAEEKLRVVSEAAAIAADELGGWLRRERLRDEDLAQLRAEALSGLAGPKGGRSGAADQKRIKELSSSSSRRGGRDV
jgi:transposase-like protein